MMDESSIIGFIISIFTAIIIVQMNQKDIAPYMVSFFKFEAIIVNSMYILFIG